MQYRQLIAIFVCNLTPLIVGNSLMSLLSLYIGEELGAGASAAGIAIAMAFAAITVSTMLTAPLSRRLKQRTRLIAAGAALCMPLVLLMGYTQNVVLFSLLLALVWFSSGILLATTQIITALNATQNQRGRAFGILAAAGALAQIIGGFSAGPIVANFGYQGLFIACASLYLIPIGASFMIHDHHPYAASPKRKSKSAPVISPALIMLILAGVCAFTASSVINVARPLAMNAHQFDTSAITTTVAIGGLINLPLPVLAGWLSDRFGRKPLLLGIYVLTLLGTLLYVTAAAVPQFWLAQALVSVVASSLVVGTAFITDIVPRRSVDSAANWFTTARWVSAVIGSTAAGFSINQLGITHTLEAAAGLVAVALTLTVVTRARGQRATEPSTGNFHIARTGA